MNTLKVPKSFRIESRTVRYTLYTLFCVAVADGLITQFLVTGGYGQQANPFMRAWISHGGFLAIKVSGAFLATSLLWIKYNAKPRLLYAITVAIFWYSIKSLYSGTCLYFLLLFNQPISTKHLNHTIVRTVTIELSVPSGNWGR
jgi:Domain of unknown function (DUF5658)